MIKNSSFLYEKMNIFFNNAPVNIHGNGSSEQEIKEIEKNNNFYFTEEYKKFLRKYDSADLPGYSISGVKNFYCNKENDFDNIVSRTNFYKKEQKWPGIEDWVIISDDGSGNPIGINSAGQVMLSDHDSGFEHIKLADDFEEFLYRLLTDTLYED